MSEIVNIDHEVGDLSEYSATVTDGGDLSVTVAAALNSTSYGLQAVIDDTTAIYGRADFTTITSSAYRCHFYIDPNGLTAGGWVEFAANLVQADVDPWPYLAAINLSRAAGDIYAIRAWLWDDSDTAHLGSFHTISDAEHHIEYLVEYASSAVASDAKLTLWIDGDQKEQIVGVDLYDRNKAGRVYLGAPFGLDAGTSGTIYLDELIFRDDSVGLTPKSGIERGVARGVIRGAGRGV